MAAQYSNQGQQSGIKDGAAGEVPREGDCAATLLVRHLPEALPADTLLRLFSHYGASAVRPCVAGRLKNCAFVDFKDEGVAARAQSQLNRLRFLGKVLAVERAKPLITNQNKIVSEAEVGREGPHMLPKEKQLLVGDATTMGASQGSIYVGEPIAPRLGIDYPFPPHFEYAYPPPDGNILTNIVNALIAVPRFYTQVLHLMNKMNLPAPFRPALPTPPLPPPPPTPVAPRPEVRDLSSDESELESSEESELDSRKILGGVASVAELKRRKIQPSRKRSKGEDAIGPAVGKGVLQETAGPKPTSLVPKEVPTIKKRQPVLQIKITPKGPPNESMQDHKDIEDTEMEQVKDEETSKVKFSATQAELEAGKLPLTEILALPMFKKTMNAKLMCIWMWPPKCVLSLTIKNYTPGNPTPVLYIKNLAKDVVVDDFYYVFGSLFSSVDETKSGLSVKLMQEGRMRGQAFVTFPSTGLADCALKMAHGFVLKGKPMIIQFGRNTPTGKTI